MHKVKCPEFLNYPALWKLLAYIHVWFCTAYVGMAFVWKTYEKYNYMHQAFDHWPTILIPLSVLGAFLLSKIFPKERPTRADKVKNA